jgi:hypothetical protein
LVTAPEGVGPAIVAREDQATGLALTPVRREELLETDPSTTSRLRSPFTGSRLPCAFNWQWIASSLLTHETSSSIAATSQSGARP